MAVLYPPYLEGKLPAQVGDTLRIPYQLNRALGPADLEGKKITARLKTAATNTIIAELKSDFNKFSLEEEYYWVEFKIEGFSLEIAQSYKIQLSFDGGYYSTVGVFKYTGEPVITFDNLSDSQNIGAVRVVIGKYTNTIDPLEKVFKYRFDIYKNNALVETSGWQTHNTSLDEVSTESKDQYEIKTDLSVSQIGDVYKIFYRIETINGLTGSEVHIHYGGYGLDFVSPFTSVVENIPEDGIIRMALTANNQVIEGCYLIERQDSNNNYWLVQKLLVNSSVDAPIIIEDFAIEHGVHYVYTLRQFDEVTGISTKSVNIGEITAYFEDAFLWDGTRQLNIKFNPQVTSFKNTILESKIDTLGGQYPFFFRNGITKYKEFPISGLIAECMDENLRFQVGVKSEEPTRQSTSSKDDFEERDQVYIERLFKLDVLEWLNNGEVKLFKSPTEGNYIVRLINVSLAPNAQLGRRLHTFSATAYETMDYNYSNLNKSFGINAENAEYLKTLTSGSYAFSTENYILYKSCGFRNVLLTSSDGAIFKLYFKYSNPVEIQIGLTGVYEVSIEQNNPLIKIELVSGTGEATYYYADLPLLNNSNKRIEAISVKEKSEKISGKEGAESLELENVRIHNVQISGIDLAETQGTETYVLNGKEYVLGSKYIYYPAEAFQFGDFSLSVSKGLTATILYTQLEVSVENAE